MINTTKLNEVDDKLNSIYKRLNELFLIDYLPDSEGPFTINVIDENTYSMLINGLDSLLKKYNRLVDVLTVHNLRTVSNVNLVKLSFTDKGSDLGSLVKNYSSMLNVLDKAIDSINEIMRLNKLIKE